MSLASAIVHQKCPRCRKGNLFVKKNPYALNDALKMPDRCAVCGQDFKMEPGFYIGALWTSFPIVIFLMTSLSIILLVIVKMDLYPFFAVLTLFLFSLQPIIIRLGRAIWISIFVEYDPELGER
ncbi:DUF983 domain-containing protein [Dyadobacter tibetensis]|uniref:DUF983 domain-containing protein n=1 Tax=Dyadobacter tibetensis TaxID=1211851 RepID=UPI000472AC3C|nr:DUF983 domain-containing protein [Dyadobacter tibetensis]